MYIQHHDINNLIKSSYLSVPNLITNCALTKSHRAECSDNQLWVNAFYHDQLPLFQPYPTTIRKWIGRYHATIKVLQILKMHNKFLSHFTEDDSEELNLEYLSMNFLRNYATVNDLPLPESIMVRLDQDEELINPVINVYSLHLKMDMIYDSDDNIYKAVDLTYNEMVNLLINIVEDGNDIIEENGLPFYKKELNQSENYYGKMLIRFGLSNKDALKVMRIREKLAI